MKVPLRHSGSALPATVIASVVVVFSVLLVLLLDRLPLVEHPGPLDDESLRQIEQLIVDHSPEQLRRNGEQRIELSTGEINLLATFLLQRLPWERNVALQFRPHSPVSQIDISLPLTEGRLGSYLNLSAGLRMEDGSPRLVSLHAGQLPVPGLIRERLVEAMIHLAERHEIRAAALTELQQTVRDVEILEDGVAVTLQWQFDALAQLRNQARQALLGSAAQQRLLHYYQLTHQASIDAEGHGALYQWMSTLFASAQKRTAQGADAVEENRSALQALALYANQIEPQLLIAEAPAALSRPGGRIPPLQQRRDLTRHLLTSAALSASAGAPVADLLASSKELHDARHGTGFSISDMMANQAGTRLGLTAVSDRDSARLIQRRLANVTSDSAYMPPVDRNDTGLDEERFRERFGSTGSEAFRQLMEQLGASINALPLYTTP
ncbi:MAG: hypothetical protein WEB57_01975 [Pseudohongiellaceae bacterium]